MKSAKTIEPMTLFQTSGKSVKISAKPRIGPAATLSSQSGAAKREHHQRGDPQPDEAHSHVGDVPAP
jgi:hypothetical protein